MYCTTVLILLRTAAEKETAHIKQGTRHGVIVIGNSNSNSKDYSSQCNSNSNCNRLTDK